jgi:hypothetical protein
MNKNDAKETAGFIAVILTAIGAAWILWKDATDPDAYDHLTKQPDGTYR